MLDSVVAFYAPTKNVIKLVPALVARAHAFVALERTDSAEADLSRAAELFAVQQTAVTAPLQRAAMFREARDVFDGLVALRAARGRAADALTALERGRALLSASTTSSAALASFDVGRRQNTSLEFSLVGDTLLTWVVDSLGIDLHRSVVPRRDLAVTAERVRAALELGTTESARSELARLYEWFIRPVETRLGRSGAPLTVVGDGEIAAIPFAALYDARRRRFLVEDYPVRWASSIGNGAEPANSVPNKQLAALFVGDPAPPDRPATVFPRLAGAAGETRRAAALYASQHRAAR
jgi:CHAT domain-containing protein